MSYPISFQWVWGGDHCAIDWPADVEATCATEDATVELSEADRTEALQAYDQIALSIAAYEASPEVDAFSAKWDQSRGGMEVPLTREERLGFALFQGKGKGKGKKWNLSQCQNALLTDYTYDNLGVPKNPENPVDDRDPDFIDHGLGMLLENSGYPEDVYLPEMGKVKVPALRNVALGGPDLIEAFGHNG